MFKFAGLVLLIAALLLAVGPAVVDAQVNPDCANPQHNCPTRTPTPTDLPPTSTPEPTPPPGDNPTATPEPTAPVQDPTVTVEPTVPAQDPTVTVAPTVPVEDPTVTAEPTLPVLRGTALVTGQPTVSGDPATPLAQTGASATAGQPDATVDVSAATPSLLPVTGVQDDPWSLVMLAMGGLLLLGGLGLALGRSR